MKFYEYRDKQKKKRDRTEYKINMFSVNGHIAGIIPVYGKPMEHNMYWPDCMFPIADGFTAIEKSVYELLALGADSIWIVTGKDMRPMIRHKVREGTVAPLSLERYRDLAKEYPVVMSREMIALGNIKSVPFYYISTDNDRFLSSRNEHLTWSILHAAHVAYKASKRVSEWASVSKFIVSFPMTVFPISHYYNGAEAIGELMNVKRKIRTRNMWFARYNGKTARDGLYLPFSFGLEHWNRMREVSYKPRNTLLVDAINAAIVSRDPTHKTDVKAYHDISTWDSYVDYLTFEKANRGNDKLVNNFKRFSLVYFGRGNTFGSHKTLDGSVIWELGKDKV